MTDAIAPARLVEATALIAAAHLSRNALPVSEVPELIRSVHAALESAGQPPADAEPALEPAVPIRLSVKPDYIVCLEDGRRLKMLRRHLQSAYGMTVEQYRAKWKLPADYPMVAPAYAAKRRELALSIGLGRKPSAT